MPGGPGMPGPYSQYPPSSEFPGHMPQRPPNQSTSGEFSPSLSLPLSRFEFRCGRRRCREAPCKPASFVLRRLPGIPRQPVSRVPGHAWRVYPTGVSEFWVSPRKSGVPTAAPQPPGQLPGVSAARVPATGVPAAPSTGLPAGTVSSCKDVCSF